MGASVLVQKPQVRSSLFVFIDIFLCMGKNTRKNDSKNPELYRSLLTLKVRIFLLNLCCSSATYQLQLFTNQSHSLNCFKHNTHFEFFVIIRLELVLVLCTWTMFKSNNHRILGVYLVLIIPAVTSLTPLCLGNLKEDQFRIPQAEEFLEQQKKRSAQVVQI